MSGGSWGSSAIIVSWLHTGWPGFDPRQKLKILCLASVCRPAEAHLASYPMSNGCPCPGRDADHSPPYSAEIKNEYEL
jgi:hypothetical protein